MIDKIIACSYSFNASCILVGNIVNENKTKNKLIVSQQIDTQTLPIDKIVDFLETLPSNNIWIAKHEPLKPALGQSFQGELDFSSANQDEVNSLEDVFLSLKYTGRLLFDESLNLESPQFKKCLKILFKASLQKLYCPRSGMDLWMLMSDE